MKILGALAIVLAIIMISLGLYPSLSQHAMTLEEPLLNGCLFSIASAFLVRSFKAINKDEVILWSAETKYYDTLSYIMFGCIIVTPVTHPEKAIEIAHLIFTALAIVVSYVSLIAQQKDKLTRLGYIAGCGIGALGFLVGFLTNFYTTGEGELIVAFPLAVHIFFTKTK